ncbi:hemicentin-2-like [Macrobrachium nipponense]|uniref:hemicentin-2-like n=1 Tax=Macrobrachium nipponense TaxID=159736 RepID=UPI0030C84AAE
MADVYLRALAFFVLGHVILGVAAGTGLYMGPYFPTPQMRNITVHQNAVAYLPCAVKQLGDKSVSWVRQRDADILTVDRYTFVRDERLTVHYTPNTETWTLVIKYVQERDAGTYECQISTEPKMSMWVHLNVIVPQVEIVGEVDKYVRKGSTTRLECTVSSTVQLPDYIFWYHSGERLLEYDNPRVKFSVSRRGGQGSEMSITSLLIISNTQPEDEGNYTCLPSNLHSATTNLHVLNDEHPAAMQTGAAMLTDPPSTWGMMMVVLIAFIFVQAHQNFNLSSSTTPPQGIVLARKAATTTPAGSSSTLQQRVKGVPTCRATSDSEEDGAGKEMDSFSLRSKDDAFQAGMTMSAFRLRVLPTTCTPIHREGSKNRKKLTETDLGLRLQSSVLSSPSAKIFINPLPMSCATEARQQTTLVSLITERNYFTDLEEQKGFASGGHFCNPGHPSNTRISASSPF